MFQKLQAKWKVNGLSLILILITFATGGSLCGYLGKKLMNFTGIDKGILWLVLYIIAITILWPLCVLAISIPLGQFPFFKRYIGRIFSRFSGKRKANTPITRVAIFASGAGSNAAKIIEHFKKNQHVRIVLVVCNKPGAGVLQVAADNGIDVLLIEKEAFNNGHAYLKELKEKYIDWIILAGFLWKVPLPLIQEWNGKIINIHPALLPKYGGKGMYGQKVHEAVIAAGDKESGISIHYVDEIYDHGKIIYQATCQLGDNETAGSLAQKIHSLEHEHFPRIIEQEISRFS